MLMIAPEIAIRVSGLSKSFSMKNKLKENFREKISSVFFSNNNKKKNLKALDNISFDVYRGEVLGIMGVNGSGKSTLLKILSKITSPDEGEIKLFGSVASILEIGTGFHPDLTGRDNIFFTGALMGISKSELNKKFDKIVEFSELSNFIDTPVKYYSSGMYVRLAFSIISELDADIILLDEVMAVGDSGFSLKSLNKIRQLSQSGKTVVLVSHDPTLISQLCDSCIILQNGKISDYGPASKVVSGYTNDILEANKSNDDPFETKKVESQYLHSIKIVQEENSKGEYVNNLPLEINFTLRKNFLGKVRIALAFNHQISNPIFSVTPNRAQNHISSLNLDEEGEYHFRLRLPAHFFNHGIYSVDLFLTNEKNELIEKCMQLFSFKIKRCPENEDFDDDFNFLGGYYGALVPLMEWDVRKNSLLSPSNGF